MARVKISKKDMAQDEFIEGVFDFGEWLEIHWRRVAIGTGVAVALVLVGIAWNAMRQSAVDEANRLLASGIGAFSPAAAADGQTPAPRYTEALTLFEQAASQRGSGGVSDVALLFRARTLMALSRGSEAIPVLESLAAGRNERLAPEAKVTLAEAVEATNPERAATLLQEVASLPKGAYYPQDAALLLLGGLRERQGKKDEAKRVYEDLIARYPESPFAAEARQRISEPTGKPR